MTQRRTLLKASGLALGLGMTGMSWAQATTMRISHAANEADWLHKSLVQFKEKVEAALPGQVAVQVHGASSLFRQGTEVPALQRGNLEMSTMTTFEVEQQMPEYGVFSSGYLFRDYPHLAKVMRGPIGKEYYDAVAAKMGIQIIEVCYLGTRQVNLRSYRDVKVPGDLAGVKLRMPAGPGWLALGKGLGVSPTPMAMPEVYLAMKTGTIDGQDNPLVIAKANNLQEVSQQFVLTSHLVQPVFYAVAKPFHDRLSAQQQRKLHAAATSAARWNDEQRLKDEKTVIDGLAGKGLVVSRPDLGPFRANADKVYANAEAAKAWDRRMMDEVMAVR
jgi:tripartite ATP-independent transporter DctP family solute receptor